MPTLRSKRGRVMAMLHPFESTAPGGESARALAVRSEHPDAILQSTFNLLRIPGTLAGQLLTGKPRLADRLVVSPKSSSSSGRADARVLPTRMDRLSGTVLQRTDPSALQGNPWPRQ